MRCWSTYNCNEWAYGSTLTPLPQQTFPQIGESWLKSSVMEVRWEAVAPFKLHPASMIYIYEMLEQLQLSWMGIWLHSHTVTTTDISPDLGELTEFLSDSSVQTIPLHYGWGCRIFQTAFHIHVIHEQGVGAPSLVADGHMAAHSHRYHHRHFPRLGRPGWKPRDR